MHVTRLKKRKEIPFVFAKLEAIKRPAHIAYPGEFREHLLLPLPRPLDYAFACCIMTPRMGRLLSRCLVNS